MKNRKLMSLTGYSSTQFEADVVRGKLGEHPMHNFCYLCKRRSDEESILFEGKKMKVIRAPIKLIGHVKEDEGVLFRFLLCWECHIIFGFLNENSIGKNPAD